MNCFVEGLRAYRGPGTAVMSQSTLSSELTQIPNHALRRVGTQQVQLPFLLIECESMSKLEGIDQVGHGKTEKQHDFETTKHFPTSLLELPIQRKAALSTQQLFLLA